MFIAFSWIVIARPDGRAATLVTSKTREQEPGSSRKLVRRRHVRRGFVFKCRQSGRCAHCRGLVVAALVVGRDFLLSLAVATLLSFALQPARIGPV
jgi:hypothetical protein